MMRILLTLVYISITAFLTAQSFDRIQPKVIEDGITLKFPFAGGMNCPQVSQVDLNKDNKKDLFIFDRVGGKLCAFIYDDNVEGKYVFKPEYLKYFPRLNPPHWALLRDFNNDKIPDIFCNSQDVGVGGMTVYKGFLVNDTIQWKLLSFKGSPSPIVVPFSLANGSTTNLYISFDDLPTFEDMDGDGDIDVVTFDSGGGIINYYKNVAKEKNLGLDSLKFELSDQCWGKVYEGLSSEFSLSPSPDICSSGATGGLEVRHIGSTTLAIDLDKDGDQDLLVGDIGYNHITALFNNGTPTKAYVTSVETNFPSNSTPVDIYDFVASYKADIFNDGKIDLMFSSNNASDATEDRNSLQLYQSPTGNFNDLELTQKDFLVEDMIDLGSGAHPAFADIDADGDQDMLIGNFSYFTSNIERTSSLYLYLNTGSITDPEFTLADSNYLDFKQFPSDVNYGYAPCFGDLDNDGDLDLLVASEQGKLFYAENTGGAGNPFTFGPIQQNYMGITLGTSASPFIYDLNQDNLNDLIVGRRAGTIYFLPNIGSLGNPLFDPNINAPPNNNYLGKITTGVPNNPSGYSTPFLFTIDKKIHLMTGSNTGGIHLYNNIEGNLDGTFNKVTDALGGIFEGQQTVPVLTNLNNDNFYELIIGNYCGGVSAFGSPFKLVPTAITELIESDINIYPNPVTDELSIKSSLEELSSCEVSIIDILGQLRIRKNLLLNYDTVNMSSLPAGTYFVEIRNGVSSIIRKIVKL